MKITLSPIPFFWTKTQVFEFYEKSTHWPVDVVYLGETICSKRRELRVPDWQDLVRIQQELGREVLISSLALIEAESEIMQLQRWVEQGGVGIEANDWTAVQLCRERGIPFVAGATLNIYNAGAIDWLQRCGMQRFVLGSDQGAQQLAAMRAHYTGQRQELAPVEVLAWGQIPLAYSARCFTARSRGLAKDDCAHCCLEDPRGIVIRTRDGRDFLCLNGIQVLSAAFCDLGPELLELANLGVSHLRVVPQLSGTGEAVRRLHQAFTHGTVLSREGECNGFWHGSAGMASLAEADYDKETC